MDASEDVANDPDSISNRAASVPLHPLAVGPCLPQELLHRIIEHLRDDNVALHQCCLASSVLLAFAQPLLFHRVKILLTGGPHYAYSHALRYHGLHDSGLRKPRNLERVLECYSSLPFAKHARSLLIMGKPSYVLQGGDRTTLQSVITLLSTCQQSIPDIVTFSTPASNISSLTLCRIKAPDGAIARILYAFPRLEVLCFSHVGVIDANEPDNTSAVTSSATTLPLRLRDLQLEDTRNSDRLSRVLFPNDVHVHLRSFTATDELVAPESIWTPILRRAGNCLQALTLIKQTWEHTFRADLTENTRLRHVTFKPSGDPRSFLQWVHTAVCAITSSHLEEVTLHWYFEPSERTACLALDKELAGRSKCLSRVNLGYSAGRVLNAQEFFESAFPRCFALGIMHDEGVVLPRLTRMQFPVRGGGP